MVTHPLLTQGAPVGNFGIGGVLGSEVEDFELAFGQFWKGQRWRARDEASIFCRQRFATAK